MALEQAAVALQALEQIRHVDPDLASLARVGGDPPRGKT
jgi:hypothetical protein